MARIAPKVILIVEAPLFSEVIFVDVREGLAKRSGAWEQ